MENRQRDINGPRAWLALFGMTGLIVYALFPVSDMTLLLLEPYGFTLGHAHLAGIWLAQGIGLVLALIGLSRCMGVRRRLAMGLIASGLIFLLAVLLTIAGVLQETYFYLGLDLGRVWRGFVTGLLFSGIYGPLALLCLVAGLLLRRHPGPGAPPVTR